VKVLHGLAIFKPADGSPAKVLGEAKFELVEPDPSPMYTAGNAEFSVTLSKKAMRQWMRLFMYNGPQFYAKTSGGSLARWHNRRVIARTNRRKKRQLRG